VLAQLAGLASLGEPVATGMATTSKRRLGKRITPAQDDLREILELLATLVSSRVQHDFYDRDFGDPQAEKVLAEIRRQLKELFDARRDRAARPMNLAMIEDLAKVYASAPAKRNDSAEWNSYARHVREILTADARVRRDMATLWCLTKDAISNPSRAPRPHKGGPKEAAKAAVAYCCAIGTGTLVNWQKRDGIKSDANPLVPCFFGEPVYFPEAVADVVELLAIPEVDNRAYLGALRARSESYVEPGPPTH
jgi:hypothetical protein